MLLIDDVFVLNFFVRFKRGVFIVIFINVMNSWFVKEMKDGFYLLMYLIWNFCIILLMVWNMFGCRFVYISIYIKI